MFERLKRDCSDESVDLPAAKRAKQLEGCSNIVDLDVGNCSFDCQSLTDEDLDSYQSRKRQENAFLFAKLMNISEIETPTLKEDNIDKCHAKTASSVSSSDVRKWNSSNDVEKKSSLSTSSADVSFRRSSRITSKPKNTYAEDCDDGVDDDPLYSSEDDVVKQRPVSHVHTPSLIPVSEAKALPVVFKSVEVGSRGRGAVATLTQDLNSMIIGDHLSLNPIITGYRLKDSQTKMQTDAASVSLEEFISTQIKALSYRCTYKVLPNRIFSILVDPLHPCLAIAGDTAGNVALLGSNGQDSSDVNVNIKHTTFFEPVVIKAHDHAVSTFCHVKSGFASASYDGTCKIFDIESHKYDLLYKPQDPIFCTAMEKLSEHTFVIGKGNGDVVMLDSRQGVCNRSYTFHSGKRHFIKCMHANPKRQHSLATSFQDGSVSVWDLRVSGYTTDKAFNFEHGKSVEAALWSHDGNYLITTSQNNEIRIYNASNPNRLFIERTIPHNNIITPFLSTYRATFHPQRSDIFYVGSLTTPSVIEFFDTKTGELVASLNDDTDSLKSVHQVAMHHKRNLLFATNAFGEIYVYSDES